MIYRVCITGGAQGGKTTCISILSEKMSDKGFKIFCVPNIDKLSRDCGSRNSLENMKEEDQVKVVMERVKFQLALEDYFADLAQLAGQPSIILCDQGTMDQARLLSEELWQTVLDETGWNNIQLRDNRYDQVIHLETNTTDQSFFKFRTQDHPSEVRAAKQQDQTIQAIWAGHPHQVILVSQSAFDQKILQACHLLYQLIGLPVDNKVFKKLLIKQQFQIPQEISTHTFDVEEVFLKSNDKEQQKIRKRG